MKKVFITIAGSLICWVLGFLLHKLFENIAESLKFLEILISASLFPFILGFAVSRLVRSRRGWIYGGVSYLLYFIWIFGIGVIFEFSFKDFLGHLLVLAKAYIVLGTISIFFAILGGFLGGLKGKESS